jgi:3-hydroxypropanoate dehydrogenase
LDRSDIATTDEHHPRLSDQALNRLFLRARTRNGFLAKPIPDALMREIYDLAKWGPTAANTTPARFVFVRSAAAKERLRPHLMPQNVDKTMAASCCVIVAYDTCFYDCMGKLFPSRDMSSSFVGNAPLIEETAKRNSTLQGAYLMIAARALGLDCGPMSGFNAATLDAEFFSDGRWKSNFLCRLRNRRESLSTQSATRFRRSLPRSMSLPRAG